METVLVPEGKPLSQVERVVDTFIAPSKTFTDLLRSASWWLPAVLVILFGAGAIYTATAKVGTEGMTEAVLRSMPKLKDQIDNSSPEQAAKIRQSMAGRSKNNIYSIPIALLIAGFACAGLYMATANFVFGGKARYMTMVAVFWYSLLPFVLMDLLMIVLFNFNVGVENYNVQNPIGTSLGYYLEDLSPFLSAAAAQLDLFSIWIFALQAIGISKVSGIKFSSAAIVALIWWVLYFLVVKVLPAVLFS
jgi:hypothetical protein